MPDRQVQTTPLRRLRPNPRNVRTHSKKQIGQIARSIQKFGWTSPILVDENSNILAGHGRFKAAQELRLSKVPVIALSGLSDAEKRALALADNKIASNAGWDRKMLAEEIGDLSALLSECELDIEITGFEPAEIKALMGDLVGREDDPADVIPSLSREPVSRLGDLWELNTHRLLCGDARSESHLAAVMGRDTASLVIADPPDNLRVTSIRDRCRLKHRGLGTGSGGMSPSELTDLLTQTLSLAAQHSAQGSTHFIFMDWPHLSEILTAGTAVYGALKNLIVWVNTNAGQGSFYRSQHELIFVFKKGDAAHISNFELGQHERNQSNVWTYADIKPFRRGQLNDLSVRPTVKPVALVADAMRDYSRRGEIVLDPFMGLGTTILAAERVGRRGYGLELDPLYVDVAVRRWQAFTGRDAILHGSGRTFDEIATERISAESRGSR